MSRFDLVIFDFDGTLADTAPLICGSFAAAVSGTVAHRSAESFRPHLGKPLERVYREVLKVEHPELEMSLEDFVRAYRVAYRADTTSVVEVFDGVERLLARVECPMAIASTKPSPILRRQAEQLGISGRFGHIQGTDGFPHKPDPAILYEVWRHTPARAERTLFVGDSTMDVRAGRAAGVTTVGITHGAHARAALHEAGAHHVIDHFDALASLL